MHLGRTIFFLVVFSSHILWEMFSSLQSFHPPWERATGRQKGKECVQKKFIEASVVTVRIEGYDIDSDTHTCYGIIFDNLMYPILKIESAKIMCFLKFSIAKIWPIFKKKHQIFIVGSSR
jgi:hypothetical protein